MQIRSRKRQNERGGVLVIVLGISLLLGISVAGYMTLVSSQHRLVTQSLAWNTALTLAEAGIEEGLAQINISFGTNFSSSANTNWGFAGGVYGPKTMTLSNGTYSVIIVPGTPCPSIIATGYASVPYTLQPVKRVVQVTTTNIPLFGHAMAAQLNVDSKGNGMVFDSYDSFDPAHSTNGLYDASTRKAGADVASVGGLLNVQNANIYGKLLTGPGGSYTIGANGSVGDLNWGVAGQVEPGWYENDFNADFRDVEAPFTSGISVTAVNSGTNTYVLSSADYYVNSDFVLNNNETLYVQGNARMYVTGSVNMKSQNGCYISIAPGATLKLYVGTPGGPSVSASLTQVNNSGNAASFQCFGLPSLNTLSWSGNNTFLGTIYAPEGDFSASGGGSGDLDWQGGCVCRSASFNGHFTFHYDENLKRNGGVTGFTLTSWQEL